jgi:hypothetical protein
MAASFIVGEIRSIRRKPPTSRKSVIKFVSDLRQVGGFLWFPPPVKLTATK